MYPTIFHIPILHIPIYGYGLMMVFAFLGTQWLASKLAEMKGIDPEIFVNVALIALISGVVGSRLSHVLENLPYFTDPNQSCLDEFFEHDQHSQRGADLLWRIHSGFAGGVGLCDLSQSADPIGNGYCRTLLNAGAGDWSNRLLSEWMLLWSHHHCSLGDFVSLRQQCLCRCRRCTSNRSTAGASSAVDQRCLPFGDQ